MFKGPRVTLKKAQAGLIFFWWGVCAPRRGNGWHAFYAWVLRLKPGGRVGWWLWRILNWIGARRAAADLYEYQCPEL